MTALEWVSRAMMSTYRPCGGEAPEVMGERLGKRCINRIELIVSFAVPAFAKDPAAPETCLTGAPGSKANAGTARDTIYTCLVRGGFLGMGLPHLGLWYHLETLVRPPECVSRTDVFR